MSVYTKVTADDLSRWLRSYSVGTLVEFRGILAGIENTNYVVTTTLGRYVLTLFERLGASELPFYLNLMAHLARHGIPCPAPLAANDDRLLGELNGKPAALVSFLSGQSFERPSVAQCAAVGGTLARMHLAGQSFPEPMENPHGPRHWRRRAAAVRPFLPPDDAELLAAEIDYQFQFRFVDLPFGAIHADLFRDNVLFDGERIGGVIDFYFACTDLWLFDLAVTLNDWCVTASGEFESERCMAMLRAYHAERELTIAEQGAWPVMLRSAALRFWLSRLYDFYLPRPGELTHAHDPEQFRQILLRRAAAAAELPWI
jgi:homoserine kinase type II